MSEAVIIIPLVLFTDEVRKLLLPCLDSGYDVIIPYIGDGDTTHPDVDGVYFLDCRGLTEGDAVRSAVSHVNENTSYEHVILINEPLSLVFGEVQHTLSVHMSEPDALTVCSLGKYVNDNLSSKLGGFITGVAYRFISGGTLNDLQPQIRCFSRCLYERMISVHGHGEEYYINMLMELPLNNITVNGQSLSGSESFERRRIRFLKLLGMMLPYAFISRFVKFSLSSLFAFFIDYICIELIHMNLSDTALSPPLVTVLSQLLARTVSSITNFFINYKFVFKTKGELFASSVKYFSAVLVILLTQMAIMALFDSYFHMNIIYTPILVQSITFFINYQIQRRLVYNKTHN